MLGVEYRGIHQKLSSYCTIFLYLKLTELYSNETLNPTVIWWYACSNVFCSTQNSIQSDLYIDLSPSLSTLN